MDQVTKVARAVLYEGYLLWPYRPSALKNAQRWTLGGVYPERCAETGDSSLMRTQVLIEADPADTVDVRVCFLHSVARQVARGTGEELVPVAELTAGGERHVARDEATEREVAALGLDLAGLVQRAAVVDIDIPEGGDVEWLIGPDGRGVGALSRSWRALRGRVEISAVRPASGLFRITVEVANTTGWAGGSRTEGLKQAFLSAHTVLHAPRGGFVSLTDPPEELRPLAEGCDNAGAWPVLVGEEGERHTMLSAPIILYDYPRIAPESPGDLFDATEIDQLLTLSVLALTEEERREIRDGDPRAREILDRCASLTPERLMRLHGTVREIRPLIEREPVHDRDG
ncbi:hypothetical protein AB0L53_43110 [Nonomuraea sp. NPDC052129]|uniref:hypothetical protein n=1 Tax=Nonomuraea sp. NPDC052129 TaxID=3154651 RepID=UPI00343CB8F2